MSRLVPQSRSSCSKAKSIRPHVRRALIIVATLAVAIGTYSLARGSINEMAARTLAILYKVPDTFRDGAWGEGRPVHARADRHQA